MGSEFVFREFWPPHNPDPLMTPDDLWPDRGVPHHATDLPGITRTSGEPLGDESASSILHVSGRGLPVGVHPLRVAPADPEHREPRATATAAGMAAGIVASSATGSGRSIMAAYTVPSSPPPEAKRRRTRY